MFSEPLCRSHLHFGPNSCSSCFRHSCDRHGLLNIDKAQFRKGNFRIKQRLISFSSGRYHSIMHSAQRDCTECSWSGTSELLNKHICKILQFSKSCLTEKGRFLDVGAQASVFSSHQIAALDVFVQWKHMRWSSQWRIIVIMVTQWEL